jgi:hypothetical protein
MEFGEEFISYFLAYDHQIKLILLPERKLIESENCLLSFPLKTIEDEEEE